MTIGKMHFLGCGNAHSQDLGNSCAVFEQGETIFHDLSMNDQPSHTYIGEMNYS